jgi:hypothetical protein
MSSRNTCTVSERGTKWVAPRAIFFTPLLVGLSITGAWGFSTDQASLTRRFDITSATTNAPITVTAVLTNGGTSAVRGFYFTEQIPSGLVLRTLGVTVDGRTVSNYTLESGVVGEVYAGYTTYRWVLETPTAFSQNNSIAPNTGARIEYSLTSAQAGSFSLAQFSWSGFYASTATASFGCSDATNAQTINFAAGSSPTHPILAISTTSMTFNGTMGSSPPSQILGISNIGGQTLNWTAVVDGSVPAWLTISPTNGAGNGAVTVSVSGPGLTPGSYSKNLTVAAAGAANSPQTVIVNLTVPGPPEITSLYGSNGVAVIAWTSSAGSGYRVQYVDNLTDTNWTDLPPDITAGGPGATATDAAGHLPQRFYRILLLTP